MDSLCGHCVILIFLTLLQMLHQFSSCMTPISKFICSVHEANNLQQNGTNRDFLAQLVQKLCWCIGSNLGGCCGFSITMTFLLILFTCTIQII